MRTVGGVICGYCSTGNRQTEMAPSKIVTSAMTFAKIGRSIKNREIISVQFFYFAEAFLFGDESDAGFCAEGSAFAFPSRSALGDAESVFLAGSPFGVDSVFSG